MKKINRTLTNIAFFMFTWAMCVYIFIKNNYTDAESLVWGLVAVIMLQHVDWVLKIFSNKEASIMRKLELPFVAVTLYLLTAVSVLRGVSIYTSAMIIMVMFIAYLVVESKIQGIRVNKNEINSNSQA